MGVSSSATSTELEVPDTFYNKDFSSNRRENLMVFVTTFLLSLFLFSLGPGIGLQALSFAVIYAIAALSLNYHVGVTGIVNIGLVGFFAVGAYASSLGILLGWNWFPTLIISIIITTIFSFIVAKTTLKLREDYFAIITIVIGEILRFFFTNEPWLIYPPKLAGIFGGSNGIITNNPIRSNLTVINIFNIVQIPLAQYIYTLFAGIHKFLLAIGVPADIQINIGIPNWYMFSYNANIADMFLLQPVDVQNVIYLLVLFITLFIVYWVFERIYNSPVGRVNKAIREDELSAESTGINVFNQKISVFIVGNILVALAGSFFVFELGAISNPYTDFVPLITFYIWGIMILGGIANNRGVILGGIIFGATAPIVSNIQIGSQITSLSGSLMNPIVPSILGIFTNFIDPSITNATIPIQLNLNWVIPLVTNPFFKINLFGLPISLSMIVYLIIVICLGYISFKMGHDSLLKTKLSENHYFNYIIRVVFVLSIILLFANIFITPSTTLILNFSFTNLFVLTTIILLLIYVSILLIESLNKRNKIQVSNLDLIRKIGYITGILLLLNIIPELADNIPILPHVLFSKSNVALGVTFIPISNFFTTLDPNLARNMILGLVLMLFILFKPEGLIKEKQIKTVNSLDEYRVYYKAHLEKQEAELKIPRSEFPPGTENSADILTAKGLTKNFGGVVGLDNVSITVKKGSLLGVIGPNGSGKSTFFNVLTGLLEQDKNQEGKINFLENDITFDSISKRAQLGMGRTFQQSRLFKNLSVLENVLITAKQQKGTKLAYALIGNWKKQESELHQQAFQILQYLNILHIWNNKANEISGGQQKLVALARALMSQSQIILLDEPVAGVNPTLAKKIFEKIQTLHQKDGYHYVIIEHNMDVQLSYCDYVFVFNKGQVVAEGTPEEIRNNEDVLDAYLGH